MSTKFGQYLNDVVSLSVIMLMALALIAGRAAGESADGTAHSDVSMSASAPAVDAPALVETDSSAITLRIGLVLGEIADSLPVRETTEAIVEVVGNLSVLGK